SSLDAALSAFAGRHSAAGRLLGEVFHLPEPGRDRPLRAGLARGSVFRVRALLLPAHCERDVHARADREGSASAQSSNGCGVGSHRICHSGRRNFSQSHDSDGELGLGTNRNWPPGASNTLIAERGMLCPRSAKPRSKKGTGSSSWPTTASWLSSFPRPRWWAG